MPFDTTPFQPNVARATVVKARLETEIQKLRASMPEINEADCFVALQSLTTAMFLEIDLVAHAMDDKIGDLQHHPEPPPPPDPKVGIA